MAPYGLEVLWHNHAFEYAPLSDGTRPIDHILAAPNVGFQIDCGWITRGGADVAAELTRFADRIRVIQTKDLAPTGTTVEDGWAATGNGVINWTSLVPLFHATGAHHLCTEHDNPGDWQRFAKRSLDYLRSIGL